MTTQTPTLTPADLAAQLSTFAEQVKTTLHSRGLPLAELLTVLPGLGDAAQYLAGALRVVEDAARQDANDYGHQDRRDLANVLDEAAGRIADGGLIVEHNASLAQDAILATT